MESRCSRSFKDAGVSYTLERSFWSARKSSSSLRLSVSGGKAVHPPIDFLVAAVLDVLLPAQRLMAGGDLRHRDALVDGADQRAEVAAHAVLLDDDGLAARLARVEDDALVRGVVAGDEAQVAADALGVVDLGHRLVMQVEVLPLHDARRRLADEVAELGKAFLVHPVRETGVELLDDPKAVMHDGGAELDAGGAQQHEFHGVGPGGDAADTGDR